MRPLNEESRPAGDGNGLQNLRFENQPQRTTCPLGCQETCNWPTCPTSLGEHLSTLVGALINSELAGVLA